MLKLSNVTKDYYVADTVVRALRGLNLCFRENEFVSVLGPSGCGKTTLLNIVGGLDHCTSGDLFIFGKSTREYKDRDWDVYRNHRVGFIFQSYNLIPHQTVLGNVELALTIAGMDKASRVAKAKAALDKVGLSDQYYKRPNQLSGGQCQRVAIARALVNDPEILLADEPTGALDTVTSGQIMDLVKEIAKERLVIMVTHNPELAEEYSTRIIRLLDGELVSDTNPFSEEEEFSATAAAVAKRIENREQWSEVRSRSADNKDFVEDSIAGEAWQSGLIKKEKAKMSFFTAFRLSLQNLFTKKRRTMMTSIAGSIGIIGVSLVLSVSYGIQQFIKNMQNDMLSGNPITIEETALNLSAMMQSDDTGIDDFVWEKGKINVASTIANLVKRSESMSNIMQTNEITQEYINYVSAIPEEQAAAIVLDYGLNLSNNLYTDFTPAKGKPVCNPDGTFDPKNPANTGDSKTEVVSLSLIKAVYSSILLESDYAEYAGFIDMLSESFRQLPSAEDYIIYNAKKETGQYNYVKIPGHENKYATEAHEVMLVLRKDSWLSDLFLAQLGFYSQNEFMNMVFRATQETEKKSGDYIKGMNKDYFEYSDVIGKEFIYYPNSVAFKKSVHGIGGGTLVPEMEAIDVSSYHHRAHESGFTDAEKEKGIKLKIVGILEPKDDLNYGTLSAGFFYTEALRDEIFRIERDDPSDIIKDLTDAERNSFSSVIGKNPLYDEENVVFMAGDAKDTVNQLLDVIK